MPPPSPIPGTSGSILLLEEYDALATAIGLALRRFAGEYEINVARALAEAEALIRERPPSLLILDFDPPHFGAIEFFERIRMQFPEMRVLVITASSAQQTLRERRLPSALQFIEKPFEIGTFADLVQALLRGDPLPALGTVRDLNVGDIVPLHCLAGATAVINVESNGRTGEIHFARGHIIHAATGAMGGIAALHEMLRWASPHFSSSEQRPATARTINTPWTVVLADALHAVRPAEETQRKRARPEPAAGARTGKKVLVIDDTETLRVFVDEVLSSADPTLQIATAPDASAGLEKIAKFRPDLVLLDYSLPDFSGDEVCRRLLEKPETARIPVIMMSGHIPEMTATAAEFHNVVATLPKPFRSAALIHLVQRVLLNPPEVNVRPAKKRAPVPAETAKAAEAPQIPTPSATLATIEPKVDDRKVIPLPPQPVIEPVVQYPPPPPVVPAPTRVEPPSPSPVAPARITSAASNAVVIGLPLHVTAIQFSPTLQMAAIRARPASHTVSVQIEPHALAGTLLPECGFELAAVDLDSRGQIRMIRLAPTDRRVVAMSSVAAVPIANIALLPANGGRALQLTPAGTAPMNMQLLVTFDLAGVELSPSFGIASLLLKSRGSKMRVTWQPETANAGVTFAAAQVLLDRSARIAEILLDEVA